MIERLPTVPALLQEFDSELAQAKSARDAQTVRDKWLGRKKGVVAQLMDWGRQDGTIYTPKMRTQLVAARTVGELLADLATGRGPAPARGSNGGPILEIAGPREENLVEVAGLLAAHRGETVRIEPVSNPDDPDGALYESGALLPGPHAILAGPTFQEWLTGQADEKA